ncbi:LysE family translocator [Pseudomonas benzenivorans]|uniref:LysE family translocator n=1 Tax=Pseudomonas benzenivorans TaxID=556533 RepID=A0ABZ0PRD8_9PSED|nr:LysE family translocator [Pseudomonas benzenivorans]WPC03733.1 LysE family translocator [Pseudomonas benzenivorans]
MLGIEHFGLFLVATLALNLTPGPDMLYIASRASAQGTSAGLVSGLGIGVGCLVHALAAAFGLSALLLMSALAFSLVKWAGVLYLIWLGVQLVRAAWRESPGQALAPASLSRVFCQGVLVNLFNPKVALFFLAFLPQFARPDSPNFVWQMLLLGLFFSLCGTLVNAGVALLCGHFGSRLGNRPAWRRWQQSGAGVLIMAMGIGLALTERRG